MRIFAFFWIFWCCSVKHYGLVLAPQWPLVAMFCSCRARCEAVNWKLGISLGGGEKKKGKHLRRRESGTSACPLFASCLFTPEGVCVCVRLSRFGTLQEVGGRVRLSTVRSPHKCMQGPWPRLSILLLSFQLLFSKEQHNWILVLVLVSLWMALIQEQIISIQIWSWIPWIHDKRSEKLWITSWSKLWLTTEHWLWLCRFFLLMFFCANNRLKTQ